MVSTKPTSLRAYNLMRCARLCLLFFLISTIGPHWSSLSALAEPSICRSPIKTTTNVLPASSSDVPKTNESWRKKPPILAQPKTFKMPIINGFKLKNGLVVELVEDHRVPFITIELGIKSGSVMEPKPLLGLSGLTAEMITEGTKQKTSRQIADEIDFIGGGLKASSDYDFTVVTGSSLSRYVDQLVKVMADVVLDPTFPEDELKLKKTNLIQALAMKRSEPDFLVEERFQQVLFGDHPYAIVAPTESTIKKITRQDLIDFHKRHYLPNESVLIVVGDFDAVKMKALITLSFGDKWQRDSTTKAEMPKPPQHSGRHIYLIDRPGSVQTSLKMGNVGINKTDPDYFPVLVANHILGGAAHSRLFLNIREKKGYTYGAYSGVAARKQPGEFSAEAEVRTVVTGSALKEFISELDSMRNTKVSDKELADAKAYLIGSFQLGLETQAGLAQRLLEQKLYELPSNYLEDYANKIMAVTVDNVQRAACRLIDMSNLVIAAVGDANAIKGQLKEFAPIALYNTDGDRLKECY